MKRRRKRRKTYIQSNESGFVDRRQYLVCASALAVAGCTQRTASGTVEEPTSATMWEKTTNATQPATPNPLDERSLTTFTPQSDTKTETWAEGTEGPPQPALEVRYAGPMDSEERRVTVTIIDRNTGTVVFERIGTLAPGESVAFEEPIGESGTYRLHVRLENRNAATEELTVPDGGIPDYVSYTIGIIDDDVEIGRTEV